MNLFGGAINISSSSNFFPHNVDCLFAQPIIHLHSFYKNLWIKNFVLWTSNSKTCLFHFQCFLSANSVYLWFSYYDDFVRHIYSVHRSDPKANTWLDLVHQGHMQLCNKTKRNGTKGLKTTHRADDSLQGNFPHKAVTCFQTIIYCKCRFRPISLENIHMH